MPRAFVNGIVSVAAGALLLVACVPQEQEPERQSLDELVAEVEAANAAAGADADGHDHGDHDHGEDTGDVRNEPTEQSSEGAVEATDGAMAEGAVGSKAEPSPEPAVTQTSGEAEDPRMEQHDDFPITATLSATCVEQGGQMTIEVEAGRNTGVVYLAYYAGGESGAPPPYGDGHGGNNGDLTDDDGRYDDTWVVSSTAPVGSARVEVMAGRSNGQSERSTAVVRFEVVEAGSGRCDR